MNSDQTTQSGSTTFPFKDAKVHREQMTMVKPEKVTMEIIVYLGHLGEKNA